MKFTVGQIATLIQGIVEGNPEQEITKLSKIEEGVPGTLTFLSNPKYIPHLYTTKASAVIINQDFELEKPVETTLIRVANSYSAFTKLLHEYYNIKEQRVGIEEKSYIADGVEISESCYVGAFSYISDGCKIGENVKIYPGVFLGDAVEIGDNTILYPNVVIYRGCRVGKNCIIHAGAVIGSDGFGFVPEKDGRFNKIPQTGIVVLEDEVEIGANTTIDRATLGETIIRRGVKIDNLVQIAHNVEIGESCVVAAQAGISGSTKLGRNCMIGGQVGIVGHLRIADHTQVGAQSGISKNVPRKGLALRGSPAQELSTQLRLEAHIRNLPKLVRKIEELEAKLSLLEKQNDY
ncbi:MAG: UDP-3-O-(3-hydroxymyristoyl)glucosamine N-acyltransferase [Bacteroidia bacterium]|nr:UDP-3-O-(3-hydroxymyristoyl)glucosamine N-acyltransferase [Bacteroidia bacterium]